MKYSKLGNSELSVSRVCLGTMTWGTQNNQQDANEQIDYALSQGINFIDTAEMYSIPPTPESYGKTETHIGNWIAANPAKRKTFYLASKLSPMPYARDGIGMCAEAVKPAIEASLQRLQTDYIDLYQLHWPKRTTPHFGRHQVNRCKFSECDQTEEINNMLGILQALNDCIKEGKILHCGLSDDTTWGIAQYLKLSDQHALPRMVSIQNEFSLLDTKDWPHLIEHCTMENVAYLPWSPLGGGMLSGKYLNGAFPEGSRWTFAQRNGLFRNTENAHRAVAAYKQLAEKYNISAAQLALKWCDQVDGVTSTIIGATSMPQLKENIEAFDLKMPDEFWQELRQALEDYTQLY